jgi:hypothetical protein
MHGGRRRVSKRYVMLGTIAGCAMSWFVIVNLALTGHTKVLHTAKEAAAAAERDSSRARASLHRLQGDRGAYVDPDER